MTTTPSAPGAPAGPAGAAKEPPLRLQPSRHFAAWLAESRLSLAFTTYQTNRLFLVGLQEDGRLAVFERYFERPMGLWASPERLYMNTRWQVWQLDDALPPGATHEGADRLYVPRRAYTTGDLDVHDIAPERSGRLVFVNTAYSCLATLSERYSFVPLWRPPFISRLAPEDRCHLNGLALEDGAVAYVSAISRSDVSSGWRDRRHEGGTILDVRANEIVAADLSMPHSPRVYRGRLWVLNSGTGEVGWVDRASGRFEPVAFCPGYIRGLAFWDRYAVVGLSKPRREQAFSGLALDDRLREKDADARCGLWVIDLESGVVAHWLELEGVVIELYDVQVLPGVRRPKALGFKTDEIQRLITIDEGERPTFQALATKARVPGAGGPPHRGPSAAAAPESGATAADTAATDPNQGRARAERLSPIAARRAQRDGGSPSDPGARPAAAGPAGGLRAQPGAKRGVRPAETDGPRDGDARGRGPDPQREETAEELARIHYLAGNQAFAAGDLEEAVQRFERALAADPRHVRALANRGAALAALGRPGEAVRSFRSALEADPRSSVAHRNLASVLEAHGRAQGAIRHYRAALELEPEDAALALRLGLALYQEGDLGPARRAIERAIELEPKAPEAYDALAAVARVEDRLDEALGLYERALALDPGFVQARENAARILEDQGRTEEARAAYRASLTGRSDPALELHAELLCPAVMESAAAIDAYREHAAEAIRAAADRGLSLPPERVAASRAEPPVEWAYHGRDNLALKRAYAALFEPSLAAEPLGRRPAREGPWRVCFVVTPGHEAVFGRCMAGVAAGLDRRRFEVVIAVSRARAELLREPFAGADVRWLNLPLRFDRAAAALRALEADAIYHWEVGTDSIGYFLAFLRLAPLQVTGWGWPDTSGAPEIDAHLTSAALAPPGADARFSEPLVRLPDLPGFVPRPAPLEARPGAAAEAAARLGLPAGARLYVCAQSLRKAHPDLDGIVGEILRRDPGGVAVFIADRHGRARELLERRWDATLADVRARAVLLPWLSADDYARLLAAASVALDPLHFGGALTVYDAFGAGLPVVTLPGELPRSRFARALAERAGVADACVASSPADYAGRAVALACDDALRREVSARIHAAGDRVFAQPSAAAQLGDYLERALRERAATT